MPFSAKTFLAALRSLLIGWAFASTSVRASASDFIAFNDADIRYEGRVVMGQDRAEFDWPCTAIHLQVLGSGTVELLIRGGGNRFLIEVDGNESIIELDRSKRRITLAADLAEASHTITIRKLTEASYFLIPAALNLAPVEFYGFYLSSDLKLTASRAPRHRIEFFGDSHASGFGIAKSSESTLRTLGRLKYYQDCSKAYPSKIAGALDADLHLEAWAGKGVVKNSVELGTTSRDPMPIHWRRALATSAKRPWDFGRWQPDIVVVQLGGNDHYMRPYAKPQAFRAAYHRLILDIMEAYAPATPQIVSICGFEAGHFLTSCPSIAAVHTALAASLPNVHYIALDPTMLGEDDRATLNHFSESGHEKIADALVPLLRGLLAP